MKEKEFITNFVFTINMKEKKVSKEEIEKAYKDLKLNYMIIGLEKGENETKHWQGYAEHPKQIYFNTVHKNLFNAHIEKRRGTQEQAIEYCKKNNEFYEFGEKKEYNQGKRNDLVEIIEMIKNGAEDIEILENYPTQYLMYNSHINKVRQTILQNKYKKQWRDVIVTYIWGETGTGKSRYVRETHGYENVYAINSYGSGAFDNYTNEDVLILEEYRSDFTLKFLLQLLDGYPLRLPARYQDKQACFTKVYIISNVPFSEQYINIQNYEPESYQALSRRILYEIEFGKNYEENLKTMRLINLEQVPAGSGALA